MLLGDWYPTGASTWEGPMCAGLFHAPSGCRAAGTHVFHGLWDESHGFQRVHGLLHCSVCARVASRLDSAVLTLLSEVG